MTEAVGVHSLSFHPIRCWGQMAGFDRLGFCAREREQGVKEGQRVTRRLLGDLPRVKWGTVGPGRGLSDEDGTLSSTSCSRLLAVSSMLVARDFGFLCRVLSSEHNFRLFSREGNMACDSVDCEV